jgi:alanine racemase
MPMMPLKQNNIWSVVHSISQLPLAKQYQDDLLFWIKVNTGMNRLGYRLDELDQCQSGCSRIQMF